MSARSKPGGLDCARLAAALLVVAIHTSPLASFSEGADFLLTRVLARLAVPFFLMVTGYFTLAPGLPGGGGGVRPLRRFWCRTLALYGAAILLYLPVNLYAGHFRGLGLLDVLRLLLFDGTMYHLWYLPAVLLGTALAALAARYLPFGAVAGVSLALYAAGLLGDSYYGFAARIPALKTLYGALFSLFSYTRNGLFYAPVFLVLGAWMARRRPRATRRGSVLGLAVSLALLLAEGLTLHNLGVQRHDSMYIALLPCMAFLFRLLESLPVKPAPQLRQISLWIYLLHPLCIIAVRGAAKALHLQAWLVENSLVHYLAVCLLSCLAAVLLANCLPRRRAGAPARAWIELDEAALRHNAAALAELLPGGQLMPAVKANAYGHGAVPVALALNRAGVRAFCVACAGEGAALRRAGVAGEILVLGYTHPSQFPLLRRWRLTQTVVDAAYGQTLNAYGRPLRVYLKIDTGMHRLGQRAEQAEELAALFALPNLRIAGAFTHLCVSDSDCPADRAYTQAQAADFRRAVAALEARGCRCPRTHLLASSGLLHYPELGGDYARVGIALYGVLSSRAELGNCPVALRPVLTLKARVALVRTLHPGESAGYGLRYQAQGERRIAVLTIGYADGLPRALSCGAGRALLHGCEAPIAGRICMDQTLVDVTGIPAAAQGDEAVLIGRSGEREITAYDLAEAAGTITNEILSRLGSRLERNWAAERAG